MRTERNRRQWGTLWKDKENKRWLVRVRLGDDILTKHFKTKARAEMFRLIHYKDFLNDEMGKVKQQLEYYALNLGGKTPEGDVEPKEGDLIDDSKPPVAKKAKKKAKKKA